MTAIIVDNAVRFLRKHFFDAHVYASDLNLWKFNYDQQDQNTSNFVFELNQLLR
jgi:hypothetical protein